MNLNSLLAGAYDRGASDVLLSAGSPPAYRVNGAIVFADESPVDAHGTRELVYGLLTDAQVARLEATRELDFSLAHSGHRFRATAYWKARTVALALRIIPSTIPRLERLGVPAAVVEMLHRPQGLLVVTGASDQGKTTTQAALIDHINRSVAKHIITLEDPVEFVHHNERSIIDQREVGVDTLSIAEGLRHALRQSPDVIVLSEMRDPETISAALIAAETGHLVMSTLHTNDACQALDCIIEVFPEHQQRQVRSQLSRCLLAVLVQRLVRAVDGHLVLATEILQNTRPVSNLIREGKLPLIYGTMEVNRQHGMQTMHQALSALHTKGLISEAEAKRYQTELEAHR